MTGPKASLVVIEYGASFPRWLDPSQVGTLAVVAQHYEGPPASLLTQVRSRLARLLSTGWILENMVLVCNGRMSLEQQAARSLLARQLLTTLRQCNGVRLVFTLSSEFEAKVRNSLCALASGLDDFALPSGIALSVRQGDGSSIYTRPALPGFAATA